MTGVMLQRTRIGRFNFDLINSFRFGLRLRYLENYLKEDRLCMPSAETVSTSTIISTIRILILHRPNKLVWHGASSKAGYRDPTLNCDGWHSDSLNKFGHATPIHSPRFGSNGGKRRQKKRHLADTKISELMDTNQKVESQSLTSVLDHIEKYPCRMPLIVLCIETVGQYSNSTHDKVYVENNNMV